MEKFRNLTKNIFFRIFLGFLGLTFITFGVGDFIMNASSSWIAKVDGQKISYNKFTRILQNDRERIYRSSPSEETLKYLNSQQFAINSLNDLITKKLIDLVKEDYGIYPHKALILEEVIKHPSFLNKNGQFNKIAFINYLKRNNLSEDKFIENLDRVFANQIVVDSLSNYKSKENTKLVKALYNNFEEKRKVDVISISLKNIPTPKKPNKEDLAEFFEINQNKFILPEFREVSYVEFSEKDLISEVKVSNSEILEYYESSSIYVKPATKDFYHMLFDDKQKAQKFLSDLDEDSSILKTKEKNFLSTALKVKNSKKEDILFDNLTKSDLLPEIAEDVFALQVKNYSGVLSSPLGFHVFYLIKENPESKEKFTNKLKASIKENLLSEKKEELFISKIEEISDYLLTSNSLKEVAKKFNFKVRKLSKFNENGYGENRENIAKKVNNLDDFIKNSFISLQEEASELFYAKSANKYYALFVDSVQESRQRKLSEVKNAVTKLFLENKKRENLIKLSQKIYDQIQGGEKSINKVVLENKLTIAYNKSFSRSDKVNAVGAEFLQDLFDTKKGKITRPYKVSNKEVKIGIVKRIISPKLNQQKIDELAAKLSRDFSQNIIRNYDYYIQKKFPVEINTKVLDRINQEEVQ